MTSRLVAVTFDAANPTELASFWGSMLGRDVTDEADGFLIRSTPTQVGLRFVEEVSFRPPGPNRLHLHLTSTSLDDQQQSVERALSLGGRQLDIGQLPEEGHVVLADPGGNEFCVIEPGNNFLAGCGHLGEVSCDGSRAVGLFWHDVLGWPLVWDQDQETAVQSPEGGTKVSWGGPPVAAKHGRNRQRLDLVADDVPAEVARLVGLGARQLGDLDGAVELADPDGNEFLVAQS